MKHFFVRLVLPSLSLQAIAPVLGVADGSLRHRFNRFAFRNEPANESIVVLFRSMFEGGIRVGEEYLFPRGCYR